jgi:multimeric flavodoxin WrbA
MKIVGLIRSYRKLGNTEVLIKEALIEAQRRGAQVSSLRLTDLRIDPCKGCMACVFKLEDCLIPDRWCTFLFVLLESDAVRTQT